MINRLNNQ